MMVRTCIFVLLLPTFLSGCSLNDKYQLNEVVLSNGLTTTIIQNKNSHSNNEVDLRLLIKAGSLQENDDELGYAHFVEHMAFNGTRDFPKNKLIDALNQLGITFGSHANASTYFDHTEYRIKLDTNEPERLSKAISILKQWAAFIEFKPEDVKAEIPIIVQEWKLREPTLERARFKLRQAIYEGSRFANRYPSGTLESIQSATPEKLSAFFQRWYTPSNTHLIVSGDIDTASVKKLIKEQFESWKENPVAESPVVSDLNLDAVPDHVSFSDSVMLGSEVSLAFAVKGNRPQTLNEREQQLLWEIGLDILKQRLAKRIISTQGKVTNAFTNWSRPSPNILHVGLSTILSKNDYQDAMNLLSSELAHIKSNGITKQEFDSVRNAILNHESSQQDSSSHLASVAVDNALYGRAIIDQSSWYQRLKVELPHVTEEQINTALNSVLSSEPHIIVSHSDKLSPPDMSQLKQILSNPEKVQTAPEALADNDLWIINPEIKGAIKAETKHQTGADEWQLTNGITVYYKHNDSEPRKVYFELSAKDGLNLFSEPEIFQARIALPVMQMSGLRQMDAQTLNQWITSKGMMLYPKMGFSQRGFYGYSPASDLTTLMSLLYVALTEARVSEDARAHILQQNKTLLNQLKQQGSFKGHQQVERELFLSDPALRTMTLEELEAVTKDQMQSIYNRYFANAQPYKLAIVGDISATDAKSAVLATIANLPKNHTETETRHYPAPTQAINIEFSGNGQRNAGVSILQRFPKSLVKPYSFDGFQVLSRIINESLNTKIREELGLVYSLQASPRGEAYDSINLELAVDLASDVDKRQQVIKAVQQELSDMAKRPISQSKIDNVIKAIKDERRQRFNASGEQAKWLALNDIYVTEGAPHILDVDKQYQNITPESLSELLKLLLGAQSTTAVISSLP